MKGAETAQRMSKTDQEADLSGQVDALAQQVAVLTSIIGQIFTQQPSPEGDMGMDAPAAPLEGY
jgi:hypothetical protein